MTDLKIQQALCLAERASHLDPQDPDSLLTLAQAAAELGGDGGYEVFVLAAARLQARDPDVLKACWSRARPFGRLPAPGKAMKILEASARKGGWRGDPHRVASAAANSGTTPGSELLMITGDTVQPREIEWIWPSFLARGKIHVLAGRPSTGKTTIALGIAATFSRGGEWPDGNTCDPGNVLIWSGEDCIEDTIVPRLMAADADLKKIYFVGGRHDRQFPGSPRAFDPSRDIPELIKELKTRTKIDILIIDPIVSVVTGNGNSNSEVRRSMQHLYDLINETNCSVIGITHFSKSMNYSEPLSMINGSVAFGAVPRSVFLVGQHAESSDYIFCSAKLSIGKLGSGGYSYRIADKKISIDNGKTIDSSRVEWLAFHEGDASSLLRAMAIEVKEKTTAVSSAVEFLNRLLSNGPIESAEVERKAIEAGHSMAAIRRARKIINPALEKKGTSGPWVLRLPQINHDVSDEVGLNQGSKSPGE